jgi:antitoxin component HigA of HigAB toxin-antitoxin module
MNTKLNYNYNKLSTYLFELGLALQLKKISEKEIIKYISLANLKRMIDDIKEQEENRWDDSHITQGERLRAILEAYEITQAQLARKIKMPIQKINDLIHGRLSMTIKWARKLGQALNLNYKTFL